MNVLQKIHPALPLRLGLGAMYAYSGYDLIAHPGAWTWAVPWWFSGMIGRVLPLTSYLRLQGLGELAMAAALLVWFAPRTVVALVSAVSCLELLFILLFAPQFFITFRDLGVLGASTALLIISLSRDHGANRQD